MGKKKRRILSLILTLTMVCSVLMMPTSVQADPLMSLKGDYDAVSPITIQDNKGKIKGSIPEGESEFTIYFRLKEPREIELIPKIQYTSKDTEYNKLIGDLESTATLYHDGKKYRCYQKLEGNDPFSKLEKKTAVLTMKNRTSAVQAYCYFKQLLPAGEYELVYSMPEQVTMGARVLLEYSFTALKEAHDYYGTMIDSNTQKTARKIKVPYNYEDDMSHIGILTHEKGEVYWYKMVLPGERKFTFDLEYALYDSNKRIKIAVINAATGKIEKTYVAKTTGEWDFGEGIIEGMYDNGSFWDNTGLLLKKGTYYVKITADETDTDASFTFTPYVSRAQEPTVTYWALGKKVVKGTCQEPGGRMYALINGKKYKSKEKVGSDGKFSISIPKVKAGTKFDVYVIDAKGYYGNAKTVTVQAIPAPPKVTACKSGTKNIKGSTFAYSTVTVTYNGKTYKANTGKNKSFVITTDTTLKKGKKFTIKVRRSSGNVSKTKTYTIK